MKKVWLSVLLVLVIVLIGAKVVRAQAVATNNYGVSPTFLLANCPSGAFAGFTNFCSTGDGKIYTCLSTATCSTSTTPWTCIAGCPTVSAGIQGVTVNGVALVPNASGVVNVTTPTKAVVQLPAATLNGTVQ